MHDLNNVPVERTGPAPLARIGLVGAAAAALVAVGILAAGATATPAGTLAAGSDTSGTAGSVHVFDNRGPGFGGPGFGGPGFGGIRGPGGGITITAISGSNLSLKTADGWTRTIAVDSGTTYSESGNTIALSDLAVGDEIRFQQTHEAGGTYSIDAIAVILPHVGGTVTAASGSTITVDQPDGTSATIKVTADTTYRVSGTAGAALSDIQVGMVLVAEGTHNSDGSLTATAVRAGNPGDMGPGRHGHGPGDWGGDGATPDATTAPDASTSAG
jgi:Domain of unknown function (DUF5666)